MERDGRGGGEYQEACHFVREEKEGCWRSLLEKAASHGEMWSVVNGMSRREGTQMRGEVLGEGGKVMVTSREKANGFGRVHEKLSRVQVPRRRRMKAPVNRALRGEGTEKEEKESITQMEVEKALGDIDGDKAAGPDGVHLKLLKLLPKEALELVRDFLTRASRREQCGRARE